MRPNALHTLRSCSNRWRAFNFDRHATSFRASSCFSSPRVSSQKTTTGSGKFVAISSRTVKYQPSRRFSVISKTDSTIYALSTATGRAAIAIIRISGPACIEIYQALCAGSPVPAARRATLRKLYHPSSPPSPATVLDTALVLYFPSPATVTGEDLLEFHVHGGPAIVSAVLAAIPRCQIASGSPVRYAEPGEFTRRAFMNNRLDLTQIEALGDSLAADTEQQRRLSIRGQGSGLSKRYEEWRHQLLYARGELEALIDFSEDQYFDESPATLTASVSAQVKNLRTMIRVQRENAVRGELLRNGISIALLGAPNAGKSSLLNRIVGREAAIVSREAGTTRDIVEVGIDLGGYLVRIGDMAGLRASGQSDSSSDPQNNVKAIGEVEKEGIARAKARALESDVVVVVLAISPHSEDGSKEADLHLDLDVLSTASRCQAAKSNVLVAINKTDLLAPDEPIPPKWIEDIKAAAPTLDYSHIFGISCKPSHQPEASPAQSLQDKSGIQHFLKAGLVAKFEALTSPISTSPSSSLTATDPGLYEDAVGASARQRALLDSCLEALDAYLDLTSPAEDVAGKLGEGHQNYSGEAEEIDIVLAAEHLRIAADCLAKITGRGVEAGDVDEVLGVVFEKFCVGK